MTDLVNQQPFQEETHTVIATIPQKTHIKLWRALLVFLIIVIVATIIVLLYLNGKSLYNNGL
jgi:uncharacterized membrane protein